VPGFGNRPRPYHTDASFANTDETHVVANMVCVVGSSLFVRSLESSISSCASAAFSLALCLNNDQNPLVTGTCTPASSQANCAPRCLHRSANAVCSLRVGKKKVSLECTVWGIG